MKFLKATTNAVRVMVTTTVAHMPTNAPQMNDVVASAMSVVRGAILLSDNNSNNNSTQLPGLEIDVNGGTGGNGGDGGSNNGGTFITTQIPGGSWGNGGSNGNGGPGGKGGDVNVVICISCQNYGCGCASTTTSTCTSSLRVATMTTTCGAPLVTPVTTSPCGC